MERSLFGKRGWGTGVTYGAMLQVDLMASQLQVSGQSGYGRKAATPWHLGDYCEGFVQGNQLARPHKVMDEGAFHALCYQQNTVRTL
jgi:hypothetical protein